ncbi:MAG: hypothetical protein R3A10_03905 [Caldilineaceae bacterium]
MGALNAQPVGLRILHPDGGPNERFAFYGDDLIDVFYQLFYWSGSPAILPKVLVDAETGRFGYIEAIWRASSSTTRLATACTTRSSAPRTPTSCPMTRTWMGCARLSAPGLWRNWTSTSPRVTCLAGAALRRGDRRRWRAISLRCPVERVRSHHTAGLATEAAASLSNSRNVVLASGGHGIAFGTDACVDDIVDAFVMPAFVAPTMRAWRRLRRRRLWRPMWWSSVAELSERAQPRR